MSEANCLTCVCCKYWGPETSFRSLKLSNGVEVHYCSMCNIYADMHCDVCGVYISLSPKMNYIIRPSGNKMCLPCAVKS